MKEEAPDTDVSLTTLGLCATVPGDQRTARRRGKSPSV